MLLVLQCGGGSQADTKHGKGCVGSDGRPLCKLSTRAAEDFALSSKAATWLTGVVNVANGKMLAFLAECTSGKNVLDQWNSVYDMIGLCHFLEE